MAFQLDDFVAPRMQSDALETFCRGLLQCSGRDKAWGWWGGGGVVSGEPCHGCHRAIYVDHPTQARGLAGNRRLLTRMQAGFSSG